jgi:hypothetical protein
MFVAAGTLFIIYAAPGDQATMAGRYEVSPEGRTRDHNKWLHAIASSVMSILWRKY